MRALSSSRPPGGTLACLGGWRWGRVGRPSFGMLGEPESAWLRGSVRSPCARPRRAQGLRGVGLGDLPLRCLANWSLRGSGDLFVRLARSHAARKGSPPACARPRRAQELAPPACARPRRAQGRRLTLLFSSLSSSPESAGASDQPSPGGQPRARDRARLSASPSAADRQLLRPAQRGTARGVAFFVPRAGQGLKPPLPKSGFAELERSIIACAVAPR